MHITFNTIAGTLWRNKRNTECIIDLTRAGIKEENIVHVRTCHSANIPIAIFKMKRYDDAILLIQSLEHGVLRHTHKLYFWLDTEFWGINT